MLTVGKLSGPVGLPWYAPADMCSGAAAAGWLSDAADSDRLDGSGHARSQGSWAGDDSSRVDGSRHARSRGSWAGDDTSRVDGSGHARST